jgi:hypothetical protein
VEQDVALVEVAEHQDVIREITEMRRQGLSRRAIAARIGGAVSHVTVRNVLFQASSASENGDVC